jgi:peptidoglycan hydrolase CwlO-like protein
MTVEQLLLAMGGISISIIGYYLKTTLSELREVKQQSNENRVKIEVMEVDYLNKVNNLNDKFDRLFDAVKDLTAEIKTLNKELSKKKDL